METITLKINTDTKKGAALMMFLEQFLKNEKSVEIVSKKEVKEKKCTLKHIPNAETLKAIDDAHKGKTKKIQNLELFLKSI